MANKNRQPFDNALVEWVDSRLPIFTMMNKEYGVFPTPRNFNYLWNFGALAMVFLILMILTGVFLAMNYTPHAEKAFDSVERIMRDVNFGWLLRYMHMNGAHFFFAVVYIHIFRGLYYGSFKKPRELLWLLGIVIFVLMMATAFMGYTLPWSQMSGWGATVITSLFSAVPVFGEDVVTLLWGGFSVDNPTLNRFFALHYLFPFLIVGVVVLHVWALHVTGSNNPLGIEPKTKKDTLPFHPYYTMKDLFGVTVVLIIFAAIVFFAPNSLGHADHYIPFNPLVTPPQIVPEWYFLPFYAILRAITFDITIPFTGIIIIEAKLGGVLAMFGAIAMLALMPWLDTHPVRSARFRPWFKIAFWVLFLDTVLLTYIGAQVAEQPWVLIGQIATLYYFAFFLVIVPLLSRVEKAKPLPKSIYAAVTKKAAVFAIVSIGLLFAGGQASAIAADKAPTPPKQSWAHDGALGTFDRAALQRGFQVYKEVCSACHSMDRLAYRNLGDLGYNEAQIKAIASEYTVMDGPNDEGDMFERPARPADRFKAPFENEQQARYANNGAYPVDLSLIVKARHYGADYLHALLTGYREAPEGFEMNPSMHYNEYFAGHQIAMAQPLIDDQIAYADGTAATVEQMAYDVSVFLTWASEPSMESRKQMGVKVMLFLIFLSVIMYMVKKKIWKSVED